jgi:hypothetical protein
MSDGRICHFCKQTCLCAECERQARMLWAAKTAAGKLATMYMRREVVPKSELDEFLALFEPEFSTLRREYRPRKPDEGSDT